MAHNHHGIYGLPYSSSMAVINELYHIHNRIANFFEDGNAGVNDDEKSRVDIQKFIYAPDFSKHDLAVLEYEASRIFPEGYMSRAILPLALSEIGIIFNKISRAKQEPEVKDAQINF